MKNNKRKNHSFPVFSETKGGKKMKKELIAFKVIGSKMFIPSKKKGEVNPYTKNQNPFSKEKIIFIDREDVDDLLAFLKKKGYDVSFFIEEIE